MIIIREAEEEDILEVLELLRQFADTLPLSKNHFYAPSVAGMIKYSVVNGCCLVSEDTENEKVMGVIMGTISVNPWTRNSRELREAAWWVDPDYRNTRAGYKLYIKYAELSRKMIEDNIVSASFVATLETSGEKAEELVSRDFDKLESHYVMGG